MASYGEPKQDVAAVVAKQMLAMARDAEQQYAEGYKAGRIAALREAIAVVGRIGLVPMQLTRLLAEAESGEDTGEVGDDR